VFGGAEDYCCRKYPNLEETGKKIARKCTGLPIPAKTLGGLVRSKVVSGLQFLIVTYGI